MSIYAYCRVSTKEQSLDRQHAAVAAFFPDLPPENIIDEKGSGKDFEREKYMELRRTLKRGDELIVKEVDRFGRNKRLIERERSYFENNGITLRVLEIPQTLEDYGPDGPDLDTRMMIDIQFLLKEYQAEKELDKIHRRMKEGTAAKLASGEITNAGRPYAGVSDADFMLAARRYKQHYTDIEQFLMETGVSQATAFRRLRKIRDDPEQNAELWRPIEHGPHRNELGVISR